MSHVTNVAAYGDAKTFDMPDIQAWIMAGAIAFSGSSVGDASQKTPSLLQYKMYPPSTLWSPGTDVTPLRMSQIVMMFTSGAYAALDYGNTDRITVEHQREPRPAQIVDVDWKWACVILGVIPLTQAIVLLIVIGFANKAVIKDGSFLATARLLRPVVDKLGAKGCLLTGDEIAEELGNFRIVYGPRMPRGTISGQEASVLKHIDVIAEEEDRERWHGRMPAGRYDGTSTWDECDVKSGEDIGLLIEEKEEVTIVEKRRPIFRRRRMSL